MDADVLFEEIDSLGIITLHRPQAFNALNHEMIIAIDQHLQTWESDERIQAVVIRSNSDRAFCAGGDVKKLYLAKDHPDDILRFFGDEYRLNHRIHRYSKPYIAFMDGITMGGGVGIAIHGSCRLASEKFSFAMPETNIGFFPDIGGSYLLSRCPGYSGTYLALTGTRIHVDDARYLGLIDAHISHDQWDDILSAFKQINWQGEAKKKVSDVINNFKLPRAITPLLEIKPWIEQHFCYDTIEAITHSLQQSDDKWCQKTLSILQQQSPMSLKVTLHMLRKAVDYDFEQCLQMEYRLSRRFIQDHDFYEGIRAKLIDKDNQPQWQPTHWLDISDEMVEQYFAPLDIPELNFSS